jgi:hypothetical protein
MINRIMEAVENDDRQAIGDALAAQAEFLPDGASSGEMLESIALVLVTYGEALDLDRLPLALASHQPSEILVRARMGLADNEDYEYVLRIAATMVALYNEGLGEADQLPLGSILNRDRFDFRAPGFIPDAYNSLAVERKHGAELSREQLYATARGMTAEFQASAHLGDTEVVVYNRGLHIVGEYLRRLARMEP